MAEFKTAKTSTLKVKINLNADGNVAQSGETVKSTKVVSLQGFKAEGNLAQANTVFQAMYGQIAQGTYDGLSAVKTTSQEVAE